MEEAILFGPFIGELFWEFFRFYPIVPFKKESFLNKDRNVKFIVYTRPDRFDIYGKYADILVPLYIPNKYKNCIQDCFGLRHYPIEEYNRIINNFRNNYEKKFRIIDHIYPEVDKKKFKNKTQFKRNQMKFKYKPRKRNVEILSNSLDSEKQNIIIGPRYRKNLKRNWPYYQDLYDLIASDDYLMNFYNIVICGKDPDYIPDKKNRFFDINQFQYDKKSSMIGVTISLMKDNNTILVLGSQSAIPNIGMTLKKPVLSWGHQKQLHTRNYNIFNTPVYFIEDKEYKVSPKKVYEKTLEILQRR